MSRRPSAALPSNKSFKSALILALPGSHPLYTPIQRIRSTRDRHLKRWPMPHITLLYPFAPYDTLHWDEAMRAVRATLIAIQDPLNLSIGLNASQDAPNQGLGAFQHSLSSSTIFLRPSPESAVQHLVHTLISNPVLTDYHDTLLHPPHPLEVSSNGAPPTLDEVAAAFRPHLSLGQWKTSDDVMQGTKWCTKRLREFDRVPWDVAQVIAIKREGFHGSFEIVEEIPFGTLQG